MYCLPSDRGTKLTVEGLEGLTPSQDLSVIEYLWQNEEASQ